MSFSDIGSGNLSTIRPASTQRSGGGAMNTSDPSVRRGSGLVNPSAGSSSTTSTTTGSAISSNPYSSAAYAANVGGDDGIGELGANLRKFQTDLTFLNNRIGEMKRRCSAQEKADAEKQLKNLKEFEDRIQAQIDDQLRRLDSLPRAESAQKRHALIKLQKDFDRVRPFVQTMIRDCAAVKAINYNGIGSNGSGSSISGGSRNDPSSNNNSSSSGRSKEPVLIQATVQDVDELILEERERDIMKINRDIVLVNEMFKDMADIIEKQGVMVEEIHASTEESRVRAEAGLEQVKQAADYQPVCVIS